MHPIRRLLYPAVLPALRMPPLSLLQNEAPPALRVSPLPFTPSWRASWGWVLRRVALFLSAPSQAPSWPETKVPQTLAEPKPNGGCTFLSWSFLVPTPGPQSRPGAGLPHCGPDGSPQEGSATEWEDNAGTHEVSRSSTPRTRFLPPFYGRL